MSNQWKQVGQVLADKKDSKKFYLKVKEGVTLNAGDILQLQDPRKKLTESVEAGRLSNEKAEEIRAKIPSYVKYDVVLPPKRS